MTVKTSIATACNPSSSGTTVIVLTAKAKRKHVTLSEISGPIQTDRVRGESFRPVSRGDW